MSTVTELLDDLRVEFERVAKILTPLESSNISISHYDHGSLFLTDFPSWDIAKAMLDEEFADAVHTYSYWSKAMLGDPLLVLNYEVTRAVPYKLVIYLENWNTLPYQMLPDGE